MSGSVLNQAHSEKRACDRIGVNRKINISLTDGDSLDGVTINISLGGILLKPQGLSVGSILGVLRASR